MKPLLKLGQLRQGRPSQAGLRWRKSLHSTHSRACEYQWDTDSYVHLEDAFMINTVNIIVTD